MSEKSVSEKLDELLGKGDEVKAFTFRTLLFEMECGLRMLHNAIAGLPHNHPLTNELTLDIIALQDAAYKILGVCARSRNQILQALEPPKEIEGEKSVTPAEELRVIH